MVLTLMIEFVERNVATDQEDGCQGLPPNPQANKKRDFSSSSREPRSRKDGHQMTSSTVFFCILQSRVGKTFQHVIKIWRVATVGMTVERWSGTDSFEGAGEMSHPANTFRL